MFKILLNIGSLALHIPAIFAIYYFWQPISNWFLSKVPAIGVDLYLSVTYAAYHLRHFGLVFNQFKDIWFGGYPLMRDFPQLAFYLMMPFVFLGGPVVGVQHFVMFALIFLAVNCYFLYFKLSHNHGLALFLAVLVLISPNIYGSATWAGSIPYFFSQSLFPLGLLAGAFYMEKASWRAMAAMILVTGLGILIHPLSVLTFLIPSLWLLIIFAGVYQSLPIKKIIRHFFLYSIGSLLAGFFYTYDFLLTFFTQMVLPGVATSVSGGGSSASGAPDGIAQFYKDQIQLLTTRTDEMMLKVLAVGTILFLVSVILARKRKKAILAVPFILILTWAYVHPSVNLAGIVSILKHDPYRAFWQFPIAVGALASFCWGSFFSTISEKLGDKSFIKISKVVLSLAITCIFAISTFFVYGNRYQRFIEMLETNIEYSSAFPEALGIKIKNDELAKLSKELLPSFMDPNDKNKRLYSADATVNLWWNAFFETPLVRGYIDPPIGSQNRGGFFWTDIAIANDSLVRDFKVSEDLALSNALFLIDWYGIFYFEGGRASSRGPSPGPSTYLLKNGVFEKEEARFTHGVVFKWLTASGKPEVNLDVPQNLNFYKIKDSLTSPILYPTNASVILIFSNDPGYEDIMRLLASQNINSKALIPVYAKAGLDDFSERQLATFDAVFLHQYDYKNKNKAFGNFQKYVNGGGKVFVDTGGESKDSESDDLPEIFPFKKSERVGYGKNWDLKATESPITEGIKLEDFGPLIFNEDEWKISTSTDNNLKQGANVLLSHKGKPVLVERDIGKGKVIWSGLNLAYHYNQYKKEAESALFINIVKSFVDISQQEPVSAKTRWEKPEKVTIESTTNTRGVLFKEQGYSGWSAKKVSGKGLRNLPIYLAGPTFPGFMYVPVYDAGGPFKVEFRYSGTPLYWFVAFVNAAVVILLLDLILLNGKIFGKGYKMVWRRALKSVGTWWRKEEE